MGGPTFKSSGSRISYVLLIEILGSLNKSIIGWRVKKDTRRDTLFYIILCIINWFCNTINKNLIGDLIYTCKIILPGISSRFSQPVHFYNLKPDNLLLSTSRFSGYNLAFLSGSNLQVQTWINIQVSPDNPTFHA